MQVPLMQYSQHLASTLSGHETRFTQAADSMFFMHEGLQQARAPIRCSIGHPSLKDRARSFDFNLSSGYVPCCIYFLGIKEGQGLQLPGTNFVHQLCLGFLATSMHLKPLGCMTFIKAWKKEAIWLRGLLEELGVELNYVVVNCDNEGAIHLSRNNVFHEKTKHINVRYHFIREVLEAKTVEVLKVGTEHNAVNALTKVVPGHKLQHCLELLSVGIG
ncbi:hypothetical protein Tco_0672883 [Tanacetum coccineum]